MRFVAIILLIVAFSAQMEAEYVNNCIPENCWPPSSECVYDNSTDTSMCIAVHSAVSARKSSHHPHIVRLFGYVIEKINNESTIIGYVMEHMTDKSLHEVIHNASITYGIVDLVRWGKHAALALAWLHSKEIIHRDVKPQNMLLSDGLKTLKLCDFGCTRKQEEISMSADVETTTNTFKYCSIGTLLYMAPELLRPIETTKYYGKCDVYSMGICLWEMITRRHPYGSGGHSSIPPLEEVTSTTLREIIRPCYSEDPEKRPLMLKLSESLQKLEVSLSKGHTEPNTSRVDEHTNNPLQNKFNDVIACVPASRSDTFENDYFPDINARELPLSGYPISFNKKNNVLAAKYFNRVEILDLNVTEVIGRQNDEFKYLCVDNQPPYFNRTTELTYDYPKCFAWSNSSESFAIGYHNGTLVIFTLDGHIETTITVNDKEICALVWNPTDEYILTLSTDVLSICDSKSGMLVHKIHVQFSAHSNFFNSLTWFNGNTFTGSDTKKRIVWGVGCDEPFRTYEAEASEDSIFKYDPVSRLLASFSSSTNAPTSLNVLSLEDDRPVREIKTDGETIDLIEWSPQGNILARLSHIGSVWDDSSIGVLWDARTEHGWTLEGEAHNCMSFSADGRFIVSMCKSQIRKRADRITIWTVETGNQLRDIHIVSTVFERHSLQRSGIFIDKLFWNQCGNKIVAIKNSDTEYEHHEHMIVLDFLQEIKQRL